jgi:hypothetical protein
MRNDITFRLQNINPTTAISRCAINITVLSFAEYTPKQKLVLIFYMLSPWNHQKDSDYIPHSRYMIMPTLAAVVNISIYTTWLYNEAHTTSAQRMMAFEFGETSCLVSRGSGFKSCPEISY